MTIFAPQHVSVSSAQKTPSSTTPIDMKRVATIILSGGQGSRLFPLTKTRCKPAMCFGGRYRLIDIPISNAINSGAQKIYVITQFLSRSLHQHILQTYRFGSFSPGFIELLTVEEKLENKSWFEGTADAVRQNLEYFIETPADYFLILSGDQLYNMDYREMLRFAYETDASTVIASLPVCEAEAKRMGIMQIDEGNFITAFQEKPQTMSDLSQLRLSKSQRQRYIPQNLSSNSEYLGSMGIYLFKRQTLIDLLMKDPREDFGKHLIPTQLSEGNIAAYIHQGYWEDIGTVESFYKANMALTQSQPPFNFYNEEWQIYTHPTSLPGPRICCTQVNNSILCEGSVIEADEITHSILGPRTQVGKGTIIRDSYVMGHDYYTPPVKGEHLPEKFEIGRNCFIKSAIIDKQSCIGHEVQLINKHKIAYYDSENLYVRDGVMIVPRGAVIPDNFTF